MKIVVSILFVLCTVLFSKEIIVQGVAPIVTSKIDAKNQALLDAKIKAVEQTLGVFIKSQTQMENYEIKYDIVEQNIQGYVSNYKVINEVINDNIYTVKIKANVKKGKVSADLNNLLSVMHYNKRPKFLLISSGDNMVKSIFESALKRYFIKNKIDIVDLSTLNLSYNAIVKNKKINNLIPYKRLGIDYIINFDISTQNLSTTYKGEIHNSVNLFITADVINSTNFKTIVTSIFPKRAIDNKIIVQSDIIPTATRIANKFANNLLIDIVDKLKDNMYNTSSIVLTVEGLKSYKEMQQFKDYLQEIVPDISAIYEKDYSKEKTIFKVIIKGGISNLLDQLVLNNDQYNIDIKKKDSVNCNLIVN